MCAASRWPRFGDGQSRRRSFDLYGNSGAARAQTGIDEGTSGMSCHRSRRATFRKLVVVEPPSIRVIGKFRPSPVKLPKMRLPGSSRGHFRLARYPPRTPDPGNSCTGSVHRVHWRFTANGSRRSVEGVLSSHGLAPFSADRFILPAGRASDRSRQRGVQE